ncbi:hypothetical protein G2W53_039985 [Senna tora]|uniref:Uncharacterized protein n=1 Tax=Senna tora TaxID=362788 RepID=A0A834T251_9FABA|nr:hypothetical protein G2W53_039985 [Senna tora]
MKGKAVLGIWENGFDIWAFSGHSIGHRFDVWMEKYDEVPKRQANCQVIKGTEGLASRLLAVVAVIDCLLKATARPFGINCLATVGRGRGDRQPVNGNGPSLRYKLPRDCWPWSR